MRDVERLHEIIDALPPQKVHALLTLLAPPQPISDEEFARRLAMAPEEEVERRDHRPHLRRRSRTRRNHLSRRIEAAAGFVKRPSRL